MGDARWEVAPQPLPRAAIVRRACAFAIDAGVVGGVVAMLAWMLSGAQAPGLAVRLGACAMALAYFGLMNSRLGGGQTLGKRLLGIRTRAVDGGLLSLPRAFARYAVLGAPFFLVAAWPVVIGPGAALLTAIFVLLLVDRRTRRAVHDHAAGSWVVSARNPVIRLV